MTGNTSPFTPTKCLLSDKLCDKWICLSYKHVYKCLGSNLNIFTRPIKETPCFFKGFDKEMEVLLSYWFNAINSKIIDM